MHFKGSYWLLCRKQTEGPRGGYGGDSYETIALVQERNVSSLDKGCQCGDGTNKQALVINRIGEGRKEDCKKYPLMSGLCRR